MKCLQGEPKLTGDYIIKTFLIDYCDQAWVTDNNSNWFVNLPRRFIFCSNNTNYGGLQLSRQGKFTHIKFYI